MPIPQYGANADMHKRFIERMEALLGRSESEAFFAALKNPPMRTVRLNPYIAPFFKLNLGANVPWCQPQGRFWLDPDPPSGHPAYLGGKYYIQEAGAMLAVSALNALGSLDRARILDLAAAPGGKSTQLAETAGNGLVVANEIHPPRRQALIWNHVRHRSSNTIITGQSALDLARILPGYFDVVVLDAPCSGEGLLAKGQLSLSDWGMGRIRRLSIIQRQLLDCARILLKARGILAYSTCTFAPEENEEQVSYLISRGMSPIPFPQHLPASPALSPDDQVCRCSRRLWPHRDKAAGAFVALLQEGNDPGKQAYPGGSEVIPQEHALPIPSTLEQTPLYQKNGVLSYLSFAPLPESLFGSAIQIGSPIFDLPRGRTPLFGYHRFIPEEFTLELSETEARLYHQGLPVGSPKSNGFWAVHWSGLALGYIEKTDSAMKNPLPRPLRTNPAGDQEF